MLVLVALINLGNSNLQSVINALDFLNIDFIVTNNTDDIKSCEKIILPGVGTFENAMKKINQLNIFNCIKDEVLNKNKPILGICLGMQLLFEKSEESSGSNGLGLLKGEVVSLPPSKDYKIPRIGWAQSNINFDFLGLKKNQEIDFYYIHSYHVKPAIKDIISISTDQEQLTAAIEYKNIYGCQFHPEKSHTDGLNILKSFSEVKV